MTKTAQEIPKIVQVGPYRIEVVTDKATLDAKQVDEKCGLFGFFDGKAQQILVHPDQAQDGRADTLLHEVLHACCYVSGASTSGCKDTGEEDHEEHYVSSICSTLLDTLRRNPDLVAYLLAG